MRINIEINHQHEESTDITECSDCGTLRYATLHIDDEEIEGMSTSEVDAYVQSKVDAVAWVNWSTE